jgi:uncharacterized membrane protein YecN with MAPEG domain
MIHIPITLFTSGVLGILCVVLSLLVSLARNKEKVLIGDGDGKAGGLALLIAIRRQGNFVEYVPLALILLGGIEASGASRFTCEVFAALLIIARVMHALGIGQMKPGVLRGGGAVLTWLVILGLGIEALLLSL